MCYIFTDRVREYKIRFQDGRLLQVEEGAGCRFVFARAVSSFPEEQPNKAFCLDEPERIFAWRARYFPSEVVCRFSALVL